MPGPKYERQLYDFAFEHDGLIHIIEVKKNGIPPQRVRQLAHRGQLERLAHGLYRLENFPADPRRQALWFALLWPQGSGDRNIYPRLTHHTALALHGLTDAVVDVIDVTLPLGTRIRRSDWPRDVHYHFKDLAEKDAEVIDGFPVTTVRRTLLDCARDGVDARFVREATDEAVRLGRADLSTVSHVNEILDART